MSKLYTGYVYIMDGGHGEIKIGVSMEPAKRLLQVQAKVGQPLEIIAAFAHVQPYLVEREAHAHLAAHRTVGEWFAVSLYAAMDAIFRAIRVIDDVVTKMAANTGNLVLREIAKSDLPMTPILPASAYLIGYVAATERAPAELQIEWLVAAGVDKDKIYIEDMLGAIEQRDLMLKDSRAGDVVLAWAPEVFASPYGVLQVKEALVEHGAQIVYALHREGAMT